MSTYIATSLTVDMGHIGPMKLSHIKKNGELHNFV